MAFRRHHWKIRFGCHSLFGHSPPCRLHRRLTERPPDKTWPWQSELWLRGPVVESESCSAFCRSWWLDGRSTRFLRCLRTVGIRWWCHWIRVPIRREGRSFSNWASSWSRPRTERISSMLGTTDRMWGSWFDRSLRLLRCRKIPWACLGTEPTGRECFRGQHSQVRGCPGLCSVEWRWWTQRFLCWRRSLSPRTVLWVGRGLCCIGSCGAKQAGYSISADHRLGRPWGLIEGEDLRPLRWKRLFPQTRLQPLAV